MTKKKTSAVDITDIVLDERFQARGIPNQEAVDEYAELYLADAALPPLEVVDVGGDFLLIDGFHRLAAARKVGKGFVRVAIVEECDMGRAAWLASAANQGHGVRRTTADKRLAIRLALDSGIGVEQSTRILAEHVGVDHKTAKKHRDEWEAEDKAKRKTEPGEFPNAPETVTTKDGRQYPKRRRKSSPDTASDAQEVPPADTVDETPDTSTLERAQAIDRIASGLYKAAKRDRKEVERISAGMFPDLVELADDVLEAAKVLAAGAAAARKEEEGEERIAS